MKYRPLTAAALLVLIVPPQAHSIQGQGSPSPKERDSGAILCGTAIGLRYKSEVELPRVSDKFKHCALSCVITLHCGPVESMEIGLFKEVMDSLGLGTPDLEDLRADVKGIREGLRLRGAPNRDACYQACGAEFPPAESTATAGG